MELIGLLHGAFRTNDRPDRPDFVDGRLLQKKNNMNLSDFAVSIRKMIFILPRQCEAIENSHMGQLKPPEKISVESPRT